MTPKRGELASHGQRDLPGGGGNQSCNAYQVVVEEAESVWDFPEPHPSRAGLALKGETAWPG